MKIRFALSLSTVLSLVACGKKEPAPTPAPVPAPAAEVAQAPTPTPDADVAQAPTPAPDAAVPPPAADIAQAPTPDSTASADTGESLAQKTGQPGWWAPLFAKDHTFTLTVKEKLSVTDQPDDPAAPSKTTEKELTGELTCTVKSVSDKDGGLKESEVDCTGFQSDSGVSADATGRWRTDGKTLWAVYTNAGTELLEPRFEHPPTARKVTEEEQELEWSEKKDSPGTWCIDQTITIGDGGVWSMCATEKDGPVFFHALGGSALTQSDFTSTLKR